MSPSSTAFEIFVCESYRDLETRVKGHSGSLKLLSFGSLSLVSY